ncbi:MAG TPA: hypothetical protein PKI77_12685 [Mycobacterium sp.]|nr:hypothetical protein [Mycobacterium sp.]
MAQKSHTTHRNGSHHNARDRVRAASSFALDLPVVGRVRVPPPDQLAYYGALGVLAAAEIIDWPIALVLATGHALAENQHNRTVRELGEALENA